MCNGQESGNLEYDQVRGGYDMESHFNSRGLMNLAGLPATTDERAMRLIR